MSEHTPGPWDVAVITGDKFPGPVVGRAAIYEIYTTSTEPIKYDDGWKTRRQADAKLMAAAPELLAALVLALGGLMAWVDEQRLHHPESVDGWHAIELAKAAIAKARGTA